MATLPNKNHLAPAILPSSTPTKAQMASALRQLYDVVAQSEPTANLLHNAAFDIKQPTSDNVSITQITTTPRWMIDRWVFYTSAGTILQGAPVGDKLKFFSKSGAISLYLRQRLPVKYVRHCSGQAVTLAITVTDVNSTVTGVSCRVAIIGGATITNNPMTLVDGRYQTTITMPAIDGYSNLEIIFGINYQSAGSADTSVSQPTMQLGSSSAPYVYRNDWAVCRRFYHAITGMAASFYGAAGQGVNTVITGIDLDTSISLDAPVKTSIGTAVFSNCAAGATHGNLTGNSVKLAVSVTAAGPAFFEYSALNGFGYRMEL